MPVRAFLEAVSDNYQFMPYVHNHGLLPFVMV